MILCFDFPSMLLMYLFGIVIVLDHSHSFELDYGIIIQHSMETSKNCSHAQQNGFHYGADASRSSSQRKLIAILHPSQQIDRVLKVFLCYSTQSSLSHRLYHHRCPYLQICRYSTFATIQSTCSPTSNYQALAS